MGELAAARIASRKKPYRYTCNFQEKSSCHFQLPRDVIRRLNAHSTRRVLSCSDSECLRFVSGQSLALPDARFSCQELSEGSIATELVYLDNLLNNTPHHASSKKRQPRACHDRVGVAAGDENATVFFTLNLLSPPQRPIIAQHQHRCANTSRILPSFHLSIEIKRSSD